MRWYENSFFTFSTITFAMPKHLTFRRSDMQCSKFSVGADLFHQNHVTFTRITFHIFSRHNIYSEGSYDNRILLYYILLYLHRTTRSISCTGTIFSWMTGCFAKLFTVNLFVKISFAEHSQNKSQFFIHKFCK
mgnify:CR=1 FL=1